MFKRDDQHHNGGSERLSRRAFLGRTMLQAAAIGGLAAGTTRLGWWRPSSGLSASGGIGGLVSDLLTGEPIAGATIAVTGSATALATTDRYGRYEIALPSGVYEVNAHATGYLGMGYDNQTLADGASLAVDFAMLLSQPTPAQQDAIAAKLALASESPTALSLSALDAVTPAAVSVPDTIWVLFDGTVVPVLMGLDEYLRHVVPYEMPAYWPLQALCAQAVAARTYAVAYGATQSHPICTTTSCQVYGLNTYVTTDQAVWSTHNVVATYNGSIITAFYFSRCNGQSTKNSENAISWQTCSPLNWNYVPYCRARSCWGHTPYSGNTCGYYGHGVGMCQWGAYTRANEGWNFADILKHYYTGIQLIGMDSAPQPSTPANGAVLKSGVAVQLRWTGNSATYGVTIVNSYGNTVWNTSVSTLSVTSPALPAGNYAWYVTGSTGGAAPVFSVTWNFRLVDMPYNQVLPARKRS